MRKIGWWKNGLVFLSSMIFMFCVSVATSSSAEGLFEQIKKRGSVTVGTEAASYPFEFIREGKIVGYNKEILDQVIQSWGIKLEQLDVPFAGLLVGLTQRKYDFIATNLFVSPERAEKFAYTFPTAAVDMALVKRKGDDRVKSVNDMTGLVVGVAVPPSITHSAYNEHNEALKVQGKAAASIKIFQSSPDMFVALANKQVDVLSLHIPGILGAMQRMPDTLEIVGRFGKRYWSSWLTRPEDTDLRDAINVELRKLRDSGWLAPLQKKWFGYVMEIPDSGYLPPGAK
jgi:polar amino acid transport system substrate-binding protein